MAVMDGNEKQTLSMGEKFGNAVHSALSKSPEYAKDMNAKNIDNTGEFSMIERIIYAKKDIPEVAYIYAKLFNELKLPFNRLYFNLYGFHTGTLPFYDTFVKSNGLETVLDGKADKVIDATLGFNERTTEDKDITTTEFKRRSMFKQVQKKKDLYGRIGISITNQGETPNDLTFETIEPFRYFADKQGVIIVKYLGRKQQDGQVCHTFSIIQRYRDLVAEGEKQTFTEVVYDCYLETAGRKERILKVKGSEQERKISTLMFYEIINDTLGESKIREIEHELLMYDVEETMLDVEIIGTKLSLHVDKRYTDNGKIIRNDVYTLYDGISTVMDNNKPLFEVVQPNIRVDSYKDVKAHHMAAVSSQLGMSALALGLVDVEEKTATQSLVKEDKTVETINSAKSDFKDQFIDIINELYDDVYDFVLDDYRPQSLQYKAQILRDVGNNMSIEKKSRILFPEMNEDEIMTEVTLVKIQNGMVLTEEQRKRAVEIGVFSGENAGGA